MGRSPLVLIKLGAPHLPDFSRCGISPSATKLLEGCIRARSFDKLRAGFQSCRIDNTGISAFANCHAQGLKPVYFSCALRDG